ncbi:MULTISPECIES: hypothetical protein [Streptomyces]|uniref:Uncharacterized protein n=1 Tax=Streptomyces desertarenae TaxID=2666184 RepID=A0ABW4PJC4_9ACTN
MAETGRAHAHPADDASMLTSCDRRITVKCLRLPTAGRPISRVTLDLGPEDDGVPGTWAALTPREARELARRLLSQAAAADRDAAALRAGAPGPGADRVA